MKSKLSAGRLRKRSVFCCFKSVRWLLLKLVCLCYFKNIINLFSFFVLSLVFKKTLPFLAICMKVTQTAILRYIPGKIVFIEILLHLQAKDIWSFQVTGENSVRRKRA